MGATANGDLGNRCYKLVIELAQLMRVAVGCDRLYQMDQLNYKTSLKADKEVGGRGTIGSGGSSSSPKGSALKSAKKGSFLVRFL